MIVDLLNKTIKQEIGSSVRYLEQYINAENSEFKDDLKKNALDKFIQAMDLGDFVVKMGDFPDLGDGKSDLTLKQMIESDIRAENLILGLYQKIVDEAEDLETKAFFKDLITKEVERKRLLVCAKGRANLKFAPV
ncbi:MAG: ferritin-like domain-containing protein [Candidatus Bathyarchaeota archaeon]|nr:ferritin-like domain-containing protein [Candidatus Bathyarchaeum tardum]